MASEADICNLGLGNIRATRIQSLDDTDDPAPECKLRYPQCRDVVLADAWWNFAKKTVVLAQKAVELDEWEYAYAWPADCLTARYIVPPGKMRQHGDRIPFEPLIDSTGQLVIGSNHAQASLAYTFRQTNTARFSPHFVNTLGWYLGAELAVPVAGVQQGRKLRIECLEIYQAELGRAVASNECEQYQGPQRDPDTIEARET